MSRQRSDEIPCTFHDVAACFSEKELKLLREWQKGLYSNLMKEIQQAFISLGPVIATCVFSLRVEGKEDLCFLGNQDYEQQHDNSQSPGLVSIAPTNSPSIKEEEAACSMNPQASDTGENITVLETGIPSFSTEVEALFPEPVGTEGREYDKGHSLERTPIAHFVSVSIKSEEDACFMELQDSQARAGNKFACKQMNRIKEGCSETTKAANILCRNEKEKCLQDFRRRKTRKQLQEVKISQTSVGNETPQSIDCERGFFKPEIMFDQQRVLTSVGRFMCTVCGKTYSKNSTLTTHLRNHTGEKPYTCSDCGKCFTRNFSLTIHRRKHTGEKPHRCDACGKCFSQSSALLYHQRTFKGCQMREQRT